MRSFAVFAIVLIGTTSFAATPGVQSRAYQQDYAKWRHDLDGSRRNNWLPLVGLFWLREGENRVGSDPRDQIPLPPGKAPAQAAVISFHKGHATWKTLPSVRVTNDDKPVSTIILQPDTTGKPTVLALGDLRMHLIQREQKFGIRVKDTQSEDAADFKGTEFYPLKDSYVVEARFIPYPRPKKVAVPTVLGQDATMDSPGEVEFTLNGQTIRLQAMTEGSPELTFILKDETSGKTTYPAGRFLDTDAPKDGKVLLDFNRAYDPPCAFTNYATCPLPPRENSMPVAVEAGEKYLGHH